MRSTEDAMTGIVYQDDSQVCTGNVEKRYGIRPGAMICVASIIDNKPALLPDQLTLPLNLSQLTKDEQEEELWITCKTK